MLTARIVNKTLFKTFVLPSSDSLVSQSYCNVVTDTRTVDPVCEQTPTLVSGHTKYRLLLVELNSKGLLGELLSYVTAQTNAGSLSINVDSAVGGVNRDNVIVSPLRLLGAHLETGICPVGPRTASRHCRRLVDYNHGQTGVLQIDGVLCLYLVVGALTCHNAINYGLREIVDRNATNLQLRADINACSCGNSKRSRQLVVIEVGNNSLDRFLLIVDGSSYAVGRASGGLAAVVVELGSKDLTRILCRLELERIELRFGRVGDRQVVVSQRQCQGVGVTIEPSLVSLAFEGSSFRTILIRRHNLDSELSACGHIGVNHRIGYHLTIEVGTSLDNGLSAIVSLVLDGGNNARFDVCLEVTGQSCAVALDGYFVKLHTLQLGAVCVDLEFEQRHMRLNRCAVLALAYLDERTRLRVVRAKNVVSLVEADKLTLLQVEGNSLAVVSSLDIGVVAVLGLIVDVDLARESCIGRAMLNVSSESRIFCRKAEHTNLITC